MSSLQGFVGFGLTSGFGTEPSSAASETNPERRYLMIVMGTDKVGLQVPVEVE